jgi:hypothetical protein
MKLQSNNVLETLNIADLQNLATEVKETLDGNFKKGNPKKFTSADYWNIQRNRKAMYSRRIF